MSYLGCQLRWKTEVNQNSHTNHKDTLHFDDKFCTFESVFRVEFWLNLSISQNYKSQKRGFSLMCCSQDVYTLFISFRLTFFANVPLLDLFLLYARWIWLWSDNISLQPGNTSWLKKSKNKKTTSRHLRYRRFQWRKFWAHDMGHLFYRRDGWWRDVEMKLTLFWRLLNYENLDGLNQYCVLISIVSVLWKVDTKWWPGWCLHEHDRTKGFGGR